MTFTREQEYPIRVDSDSRESIYYSAIDDSRFSSDISDIIDISHCNKP